MQFVSPTRTPTEASLRTLHSHRRTAMDAHQPGRMFYSVEQCDIHNPSPLKKKAEQSHPVEWFTGTTRQVHHSPAPEVVRVVEFVWLNIHKNDCSCSNGTELLLLVWWFRFFVLFLKGFVNVNKNELSRAVRDAFCDSEDRSDLMLSSQFLTSKSSACCGYFTVVARMPLK